MAINFDNLPFDFFKDGYQTVIVIDNGELVFYEREVAPPGLDTEGSIDTTTMRNGRFRTKWPRALLTLTPVTARVAYTFTAFDTDFYNRPLEFKIIFPDANEVGMTFWGMIESFKPERNKEGELPVAELIIVPTNMDANGHYTEPSLSVG